MTTTADVAEVAARHAVRVFARLLREEAEREAWASAHPDTALALAMVLRVVRAAERRLQQAAEASP